ncbi:MAG TPA: FAD-dependent oxidoreductase [Vulgatibacter sp.]|nr:FAD-dependent oxidoreductase [Vulgatibacter sp.]
MSGTGGRPGGGSARPIVIGAGPSGLAAAWSLVRAGQRPLVLEAADEVGGLSASFDVDGFRADYGPHRLHRAASDEVMELYRLALGSALLDRERSGVVHLEGRRLPFPLSLSGLWRGLGPLGALAHGLSAVAARIAPPRADDFAGEAGRRLGRRASARLYEPAARKVCGLPPSELDAAFARARISADGPGKVLRAAVGEGRSRRYFYPERGSGALAQGLADRIREAGGEIRTGSVATGLRIEGGRIAGVQVDGEAIDADRVVATAPLPTLCAWVGGRADASLGYRALVLLYLVLATDRVSAHDVHYFADERIPANRLFEAKGFTAGAGPRGRTLVGFDLPCAEGDDTWNARPEALVERVRPALEIAGAGGARILATSIRRVAAAYPLLRKGYAAPRDRALDALAAVEGLYPVGRHALFVHDNVHHACAAGLAAGRAAARAIGAGAWREELRRFVFARIED